jgi:ankyrin repeat protein
MLHHDQGVVSKPTMTDGLALHLACRRRRQTLDVVKLVYNAYPQAMHTHNNDGETPLDILESVDMMSTPRDICENVDVMRRFLEAQLEWERQAREQTQPDEQGQLPIHRFLQSPDVPLGTAKLMISANPESAKACDSKGFIPLHYACKFGHVDVVKILVDLYKESMKRVTLSGDLPLHIACREGKCSVINWIMDRSDYGVSLRNKDGKLPIELLLCGADVDRDSLAYIEAVNHLLRANPDVLECA